MKVALAAARRGIRRNDGGPFGACIIRRGRLIATAHNTVLRDQDPTCHAEINVIREACRKLGTFDLSGCTLYTTAEPCPMCFGAIYWARLARVVIGADMAVAAHYGFSDAMIYAALRSATKHKVSIRKGIMATACRQVFEEWRRLGRPLY